MNADAFIKVDKATFYAFIQAQGEGRYEYVRGRIMQQQQGGTLRHSQLSKRFLSAVDARIDQDRRVANGSDRGVETSLTIRYPDVSVEAVGADPRGLATLQPVLVVEVLSDTSEDRDLFVKPAEYLGLPSLEAYVIASQDEPACLLYVRGADRRFAEEPEPIRGEDQAIEVPALSLTIPLSEIYRGLFRSRDEGEKS